MQHNALLFLTNWFHQYVQGFYSTDEELHFHVRLKEEHTLRVLQYATDIGSWLAFLPKQLELAKIAALLHDVGRFKQYQTYRTFNDGLSINHAELGLEILEQFDILTAAGLSAREQDIVKKAILYHNRRRLPSDIEDDDCLLLSQITRDADKLDIYSMLVTEEKENQIPHPPELQYDSHYSQRLIEDILQGKLIQPRDRKTSADLMLFRLSWIYDIYFPYSFSYILQQQYLEKLIATLPDTEDIQRVYGHVRSYVEQRATTSLIRIASIGDIAQITEIYNQGIQDRIATLEADTKTVEEMEKWFAIRSDRHKVIVVEDGRGYIKGWASLNIFNARACYQGVADLSIYIRQEERGKGLGKSLLTALVELAKQSGFHKLVLSTFAFNGAGQKLYASLGFVKVGTYMKQGMLDGKWIDMTIMEKFLLEE